MTLVIVPDYIHDEINQAIEAACVGLDVPDEDKKCAYDAMLNHVNEHGTIPTVAFKEKTAH